MGGAAHSAANPADMEAASAEAVIDGVVSCASCGRFPLVGEQVTSHLGGGRLGGKRVWACQTCESDGRAERFGSVTEIDRVRTLSGLTNVRRA